MRSDEQEIADGLRTDPRERKAEINAGVERDFEVPSIERMKSIVISRLTKLAADFPDYDGEDCRQILVMEIDALKEVFAAFKP